MRVNTLLLLGGVGVVGYFLWKSLQSAAPPSISLPGIPTGLQAQLTVGAPSLTDMMYPIGTRPGYGGF